MADEPINPLVPLAALGLAAFESRPTNRTHPLLGLTVAVTRDARSAAALSDELRRLGATVLPCPTIEIVDPENPLQLDDAVSNAGGYDWIVFTSANGVERAIDRVLASGRDVRAFGEARIAAVGSATAGTLSARGLRVDVVPEAYVAESLIAALQGIGTLAGARILFARAAVARDVLPDALRDAGASVDVVEVYRTVVPTDAESSIRIVLETRERLLVTFTSSSTVSNFARLAGDAAVAGIRAACIGPITAATARESGFSVVVEATPFTTAGLVEAIVRWAIENYGGHAAPLA